MLRVGMNVNLRSSNRAQSTALLKAVNNKHTSVVQLLLKNGALPDMSDARSRRPLVVATNGRSDVAITKLLLEHGATADSVVFDKNAPLMEAVRSNQESKVVWLLKHGANTHILDRRTGMTLVHIAASKNATPGIINILIGSGIQVESQDDMGRTPLQVAAVHSCTRAVRLLLNIGANPKTIISTGKGGVHFSTLQQIPAFPAMAEKASFEHYSYMGLKSTLGTMLRRHLCFMRSRRAPLNRRKHLLNVVPVSWLQTPMEKRSFIWPLLHRAGVPV
mgnify:CR=1 FL=1